jgi:hypothetical protein
MSFFEAMMLICFGAAWPASIYRSYVSRSIKGKSLLFLLIVEVGYLAGILHKILYSRDLVIYLYILNLIMVGIDIGLYFRNRYITRREMIS